MHLYTVVEGSPLDSVYKSMIPPYEKTRMYVCMYVCMYVSYMRIGNDDDVVVGSPLG